MSKPLTIRDLLEREGITDAKLQAESSKLARDIERSLDFLRSEQTGSVYDETDLLLALVLRKVERLGALHCQLDQLGVPVVNQLFYKHSLSPTVAAYYRLGGG